MDRLSQKKRVIGVDIRVEMTTCAIVDVRGSIVARTSFPTTDYPDVTSFIAALSEAIITLAEQNGGVELIRSVGISSKSANFMTGCIEHAANLPWKGVVPLGALLRDRLGMAVAVANNAHVIALAEHTYGAAHGMKNFIVITIGNGLGSAIYSNGHIYLGNSGFAGEVGHVTLVHGGRLCGCGNRGCLEAYTAARGIVSTAHEVMEEDAAPSPMRKEEALSPSKIAAFCEQGDKLAQEVMRRTGQWLGRGLANYATTLNPEAIIMTGGIARAGHWLLDPMRESFDHCVFHNVAGKTAFYVSDLSEDERGVLGAGVLAWEVAEYSLFK